MTVIDVKNLDQETRQKLLFDLLKRDPGESTELDPDEGDPTTLWAEIWRLRAEAEGPSGYATWKEAAIAERQRRVSSEGALGTLRQLLQGIIDRINDQSMMGQSTIIDTSHIRACLDNPNTQLQPIELTAKNEGAAEKALEALRALIYQEIAHAEINELRLTPSFGKLYGDPAVRIDSLHAVLGNPTGRLDGKMGLEEAHAMTMTFLGLPVGQQKEVDVPQPWHTWRHRKGGYYTVIGVTSQAEPEKAEKFPRTVFYFGSDGRIWSRTLKSWRESFTYYCAVQPPGGVLKKDDMRVINGVVWYCTDPEIDRWVSQGGLPDFTTAIGPTCTCNAQGTDPHHEFCPVTHAVRAAFAASGQSAQG